MEAAMSLRCHLQVVVYLRVVFLKLGEIDTMKENFAADAFVQAKWREPLFDGHLEIVSLRLFPLNVVV